MSEAYVPQKGIAVWPVDRAPKNPNRKYPFPTLKVGEMIFIPGAVTKKMSAYVSKETKDLPGKFVTRHGFMRAAVQDDEGVVTRWEEVAEDAPGAVEGTAVWRTE